MSRARHALTKAAARLRHSHVVHWLPPSVLPEGHPGVWDLQSRRDYRAGRPNSDPGRSLGLPRDANRAQIRSWTQGTLGTQVRVRRSHMILKPDGAKRGSREPVYYVRPKTRGRSR